MDLAIKYCNMRNGNYTLLFVLIHLTLSILAIISDMHIAKFHGLINVALRDVIKNRHDL